MQFAQRQRPGWKIFRPLLVAILVGLLLGFLGPFGSNPAYPRPTRYAFWLALTVAGMIAVLGADALLHRTMRAGWTRMAAVALLSALPMTFVVAWTMTYLQPGRVFAPQQLPGLFTAVAAVQLLIAFAAMVSRGSDGYAGREDSPPDALPPVETPACFPAALVGKLPATIAGDIVAIETEDHYLRVHTRMGSALILMRMADAVASIDPRLGAQVHRRWWVADSAVEGLETDGQKLSVRISRDKVVPVGRTFAAAVRARFGRV